MKQSKLTLSLTKSELIAGWAYLAFWYLLLPSVLVAVCNILGITSPAVANLIYYGINAVCCGLLFRRMLRQSWETVRRSSKTLINATVVGFASYLLATYWAGLLIVLLKPDFVNANDAAVGTMLEELPLLMAFAVIVLVPMAEECLFRGLLFVPLARKNRILGYTVTIVIFSAVHIIGYLDSYDLLSMVICLLQYIPGAAVLCWACESSDSLIPPMIIHAIINAMATLFAR